MSKVYSMFDLPESKPTCAGLKERKTFRWAENENGEKILVEDETINIQEEIESFHDETRIENVIRRATYSVDASYQLSGDTGMDIDLTRMPENLMDAQNIMLKAKARYAALPDDIKANFKDLSEFMTTAGTEEWALKMGWKPEKETVKEETHEQK